MEKANTVRPGQPSITVQKYSLSEVKPILDDNLRLILADNYGYIENHRHSNFRLFLGLVSSIVAAIVAYYCWVTPFQKTRYWTIIGVLTYFILNGIYVLYVTLIEKSQIFVGKRKSDKKEIIVSTELRNHDPVYRVKFQLPNGSTVAEQQLIGAWIDQDGKFVQNEFNASVGRWMAKNRLN